MVFSYLLHVASLQVWVCYASALPAVWVWGQALHGDVALVVLTLHDDAWGHHNDDAHPHELVVVDYNSNGSDDNNHLANHNN